MALTADSSLRMTVMAAPSDGQKKKDLAPLEAKSPARVFAGREGRADQYRAPSGSLRNSCQTA